MLFDFVWMQHFTKRAVISFSTWQFLINGTFSEEDTLPYVIIVLFNAIINVFQVFCSFKNYVFVKEPDSN